MNRLDRLVLSPRTPMWLLNAYYSMVWPVVEWGERIWYAHHNARVLTDMEWRLACVLTRVTRGMSKAYYSVEAMNAEIDSFLNEERDDAYEEGFFDGQRDGAKHIEVDVGKALAALQADPAIGEQMLDLIVGPKLQDDIAALTAAHEQRVNDLLVSNNQLLERARAAEARLADADRLVEVLP